MLRIKAMNSGELVREDFGFSVAVGSLSQALAGRGRRGFETVMVTLHQVEKRTSLRYD